MGVKINMVETKTNIEQIKKILRCFLTIDIKNEDNVCGIISHPVFDTIYIYDEYDKKILNISIKEELSRANEIYYNKINQCKNITECFNIIRKPYYLVFLKYIKPYLSISDFSELLGFAWIHAENPNSDINVPIAEIEKWFMESDKIKLMTINEYDMYNNLPEVIEVYRGIGEKTNIHGMSWSIQKNTAKWFAERFRSDKPYIIQGTANKKNIMAFFARSNEDELVIPYRYVENKEIIEL